MTLAIGSLFSGIGGLELGLERAGLGPVVWQVEREPYCCAVLAKHWPNAARYDDVCTVGAHTLAPVDVICGGFPCQDISVAGKGAGIDGARSGLWSEYARLIRELRPRYVVVENVPALLGRGLDRVLGELAAGGYDAEWDCVPAASVGAPHLRDRLFVLAYANGDGLREQSVTLTGCAGPALAVGDGAARDVADAAAQRLQGRGLPEGSERRAVPHAPRRGAARQWWAVRPSEQWRAEPDVCRVADGVPFRMDRLAALGNAVVPQVAEVVGRLIVAREAALAMEAA